MAELSLERYWQLPPVARTLATATFLVSAGVHFKLISGYYFIYDPYFITKVVPPQIWRLATCFMITGPQLGILFDTFFIFTYLSQLEKGHPRLSRRADLIWYLIVMCAMIQALSHLTGFNYPTLTPALILAMCYTATQEQQGGRTNYMFFDIPSQTVPYAMLVINLFFPGGVATMIQQLHGLVAAHLYLFLTKIWPEIGGGTNFLGTPALLVRLVGQPEAHRGASAARPDASSGRNMGPLPDSWRTRGPGHRLG